jgi:alpha-beta hydrolase superfamily lysophospholipase
LHARPQGPRRSAGSDDREFVRDFELFVRDVGAFIEFASRRYGAESVHFLGHSMGGLIAVYYRNDREGLRTLMTSGAAVYLAPPPLSQRLSMSLLSALRPRARVQLPIDPRELSIDESVGKAYMEDQLVAKDPTARLIYELYRGLREVWRYVNRVTVLMLILHGKDDRVVSPEASERLYRAIQSKDKCLITFEGMKREILSERIKAAAYKEVLGWLSSH